MDLLEETRRELTEAGFGVVPTRLNQEMPNWRQRTLAILTPGQVLLAAGGFFEQVFVGVVRAGGISMGPAVGGPVRIKLAQPGHIRLAAGVKLLRAMTAEVAEFPQA
ncbi:hypothetical protein LJ737_04900 [Hymenobacter sp. 15J16-1T3B]|uniref:hypothetical protein n=1 Tax=Hymenobacter sp. 15J16-1T3B TaxID=2886941 RepID=UPI001D10FEC5|nr:hypothetical protein [Hymenobacter sp. 15J16-1T3B]MCC3156564.1 hypothetical protein [Hymenobacter sp. 15J16-1T3B]